MTTGRINQVTIRHGRGVGNYRAGASRRTRVRFRTAFRPTSWEPATRERQTSHRPKDAQLSLPRLTLGPSHDSCRPLAQNKTKECKKSASAKEKNLPFVPLVIVGQRPSCTTAIQHRMPRGDIFVRALNFCDTGEIFEKYRAGNG